SFPNSKLAPSIHSKKKLEGKLVFAQKYPPKGDHF
ncbi:hypothetical protein AAULH_11312, partial [Lactobacillus helveticus MTCC 5463]